MEQRNDNDTKAIYVGEVYNIISYPQTLSTYHMSIHQVGVRKGSSEQKLTYSLPCVFQIYMKLILSHYVLG